MTRPEWWVLDADELEDYVDYIACVHKLNETQSAHLLRQLRWERGYAYRTKPARGENWKQEIEDFGLRIEKTKVGSGITARTVTTTHRTGQAAKLFASERKLVRKMRRHAAKKPFSWRLSKDTETILEEALWAAGCLQIDYGHWIVPKPEMEPHAGAWWYCEQITQLLENARKQCGSNEAEFAAFNAFRAGELLTELTMRLAHNEFFEKQTAIAEAQRSAPKARRKQTDHVRRERVRYYMTQGDKPTNAAENAAKDLGVSMSTIRRAFPDQLLPESPDDF